MKGDTLIQETQRIPHGTIARLCHIAKCLFLHLYMLCAHQFRKPVCNGINRNPVKIISLASGKNGNGNLVGFRGGQNKNDVGRRLLQGFKQRVECSHGKHVHLVDNVHLILSFSGAVGNFLPDLADIFHTIIGCRINLDYIHRSPGGNALTDRAFPTGTSIYRMFTVHCFCKNFCNGSLSGSSCTAEKISMSYAIGFNLIF